MTLFCFLQAAGGQETQNNSAGTGASNGLDGTNPFPRASVLGAAFAGVADDPSALFTNPAGLAYVRRTELSANTDLWLVNTYQECLVGSFPNAPGWGTLALTGGYLGYGSFEGRDSQGNLTSNYSADRINAGAGWGVEVAKDLALGVSAQGAFTTLATYSYSNFSGSLGLLWKPLKGFQMGAACGNAGFSSAAGAPETSLNLGASYQAVLDPGNRLLLALGGTVEPGSDQYLGAGAEYAFGSQFFLRAGYQLPLDDEGIGGLTGLTAGIGLALGDLRFDYAYLPYGDLGTSHRISVGYSFSGKQAPPAAKAPPGEAASAKGNAKGTAPGGPPMGPPPPPFPLNGGTTQVQGNGDEDSLTVVQFDASTDLMAQGAALEKQGRFAEAIKAYQSETQKDPDNAAAWWAMGNLYYRFHQKQYAVFSFERVLKLQPGNADFAKWLSDYEKAGP